MSSEILRAPKDVVVKPSDIQGLKHTEEFLRLGESFSNAAFRFLFLKASRSPETLKSYNRALALFSIWMAKQPHLSVDEHALARFQADLQHNPSVFDGSDVSVNALSSSSVRTYMGAVLSFVSYLHLIGAIPYNSAKHVQVVGTKDREFDVRKAFSREQFDQVMFTLDSLCSSHTQSARNYGERMRFSILFGYAMALRVTEQAATTHGNMFRYDEKWRLDIQAGKGGKKRRRLMHDSFDDSIALDSVIRYRNFLGLSSLPTTDCHLSCLPSAMPVKNNTQTKKPQGKLKEKTGCLPRAWQTAFKEFCRDFVLPQNYPEATQEELGEIYQSQWGNLTPHSLRHTRITHLIQNGFDPFLVSRFAGHTSITTTQIYVDVSV